MTLRSSAPLVDGTLPVARHETVAEEKATCTSLCFDSPNDKHSVGRISPYPLEEADATISAPGQTPGASVAAKKDELLEKALDRIIEYVESAGKLKVEYFCSTLGAKDD